MINYIPQLIPKLIIFLSYFVSMTGCTTNTAHHLETYKTRTFILPSGEEFKVFVAETYQQQKKGLSGIKVEDFPSNMGMLFPEKKMRIRQFWMPETYFNLDLFFMNSDYYILDFQRELKHYPKKGPRSKVPLSKEVFSQHVLEVKSGSPLAKKLYPGIKLIIKE